MTLEEKKQELINLLPTRQVVKPATYDNVKATMNTLVHEYADEVISEAPAASTRSSTGIYQIILPSDIPEYAKIPLDEHECGHCIFQHLKDSKAKIEQVKRQLRTKWPAFKNKIENDENLDEESLLEYFARLISNVAMDFEVNSKYFGTGDDWKVQNENISVGIIHSTVTRMKEMNDELFENLKKELSDTEDVLKSHGGMHPEAFGFPSGMSWMAYINLMLTNPNKFMSDLDKQLDTQKEAAKALNNLMEQMQQGQSGSSRSKKGKNGNSQNGSEKASGNGKDKNDKNGSGSGKDENEKKGLVKQPGDRKVKASVIKEANEKQARISNEAKAVIKKRDAEKAKEAAANGPQEGGDDDWTSSRAGMGSDIGDSHSRSGAMSTSTDYHLSKDVRAFIEKCCLGNAVTYEKQDPLYNYNRGKCGNNGVMRMRTTVQQVYRPGNLIAVIDVSGSVNIELVKALLNELKKYRSNFGYRSRIILWDTDLIDDIEFKKFDDKIHTGGGTDIAPGIVYAKKYLKSDADKLFIISDFEDYLDRWVAEIESLRADVFGICWGGSDGKKMLRQACSKKKIGKIERMKVMNVA